MHHTIKLLVLVGPLSAIQPAVQSPFETNCRPRHKNTKRNIESVYR